jgi:hypothetical protein
MEGLFAPVVNDQIIGLVSQQVQDTQRKGKAINVSKLLFIYSETLLSIISELYLLGASGIPITCTGNWGSGAHSRGSNSFVPITGRCTPGQSVFNVADTYRDI